MIDTEVVRGYRVNYYAEPAESEHEIEFEIIGLSKVTGLASSLKAAKSFVRQFLKRAKLNRVGIVLSGPVDLCNITLSPRESCVV
jgi:hypothetical protein